MNEKNLGMNIFFGCFLCSILIVIAATFMILVQSCTYNVSLVHTEGQATNVGDETADADPDISPNLTLPLTTP